MPRTKAMSPTETVVAHAAIGRAVVEAVRESGLLRPKRRAARKAKRKVATRAARKPRVTRTTTETAASNGATSATTGGSAQ